MKQLKRLSLTELSDRELKDRQMNQLKGGDNIYCTQKMWNTNSSAVRR